MSRYAFYDRKGEIQCIADWPPHMAPPSITGMPGVVGCQPVGPHVTSEEHYFARDGDHYVLTPRPVLEVTVVHDEVDAPEGAIVSTVFDHVHLTKKSKIKFDIPKDNPHRVRIEKWPHKPVESILTHPQWTPPKAKKPKYTITEH